jgi:tRNA pseudouridine32 synthase/23S rRNA pseudouridine746 synthase
VIERRGELTCTACSAHGAQHQLRVHLAALGIPIVNDAFYPVALPCKQDDVSQPLQLLARAISFIDPLSGEWREFRSRRTPERGLTPRRIRWSAARGRRSASSL